MDSERTHAVISKTPKVHRSRCMKKIKMLCRHLRFMIVPVIKYADANIESDHTHKERG